MPKKISRKSFLKYTFGSLFALAGISTGGYFYAHEIEPRMLDVTHHKIINSAIPPAFDGFKIVQFSDTHIGFHYDLNQFQKLIAKINNLEPDIIVFTGDLMDDPSDFKETEKISRNLRDLNANFGKFAVYGNHDHGGYGSDIYRDIIESSGFSLLVNEAEKIELLNEASIYLLGVDDAMLGKPSLDETIKNIPEKSYKILLSHAPDLASAATTYNIDFQLSGHSHGGQIQIPFYGPLVTPPQGKKYTEGFYYLGDEDKGLTLYVNRGLGTTRLPFRFFSKPELTLFTLSAQV
ncbi:metallophosphoesterase [Bacillus sp. B15-48]|uniref:metallophosphoesterase n=1 Tax=Bacillus sp. B15-48 TaxID=1548601 RepID=UPI00193F65C0|nr:metallophosphoesterase [Bacillus sp. B15-48]MBM4764338.1 metallophosphoesterase [Bacillus sp. B15-48]